MTNQGLTRRGFLAGAAAVGVGAAFSLAGCSSGSNAAVQTNSEKDETPQTLRAAAGYQASSFNPVGVSSALALAATWHVFEGLYEIDMRTFKTRPALAKDDPVQVSETEYEVTLRDGATFSDGTAVTAADVVNAFEQNIENVTYAEFFDFLENVESKDDSTVTFNLAYPFEQLLKNRLALVKIFPAAQTAEDLAAAPIGSGPWAYSQVNGQDGGEISFAPNAYYDGEYPATCAEMVWEVHVDSAKRAAALTDGEAAVVENTTAETVDDLEAAGATVEYVPGFAQPFFMFNTKKAPFDDVRVRQAFFYALDIDKLIATQMDGHAAAVTGFLPLAHSNYNRAQTVYTYDTQKAKQLLAEAGQANLTCELMVNSNWVGALAPQIQTDLAAAGITATVNETSIPWADLAESDDVLPFDVVLTSGDPTCFGNDPDLLLTWWYGDNAWTQGRTCWKGSEAWTELQSLLQAAREESDSAAQQETWNKAFDLVAENAVLYPLFHKEIATAYRADALEGYSPISTSGLMLLGVTPKATE